MAEQQSLGALAVRNYAEAKELIGRLFEVVQPSSVFGSPVQVGERTVITASETWVSMGFGFGFGGCQAVPPEEADDPDENVGGGGGGGGYAGSRAVAVISVGPKGVSVEPIIDVTKLGLAFLAVFTAFFAAMVKLRKIAGG